MNPFVSQATKIRATTNTVAKVSIIHQHNARESVKAVLLGLGRLNVPHLIMLRKVNFYRHLFTSNNQILSCALHSFMLRRCDVVVNSVFSHKFSAVQTVYDKFAAYVDGFN